MGTFSKESDCCGAESSTTLLSGAALPEISRGIKASGRHAATQKTALILQLLRRKARGSRNKKPQPFYSIRAVANHFGVPATTVSRIYSQLKSEGLLTSVWGSKTFVEPGTIDNQLRVRAIVALPASLTSFCTGRQYRNFFVEMRNALWKFGFGTRLLFYEGNDAQLPSFAELLLGHRPEVVIWYLPTSKMKGTVAQLLDRGIRLITVADCPSDCRAHRYYVDREHAVKNALVSWRQNGIRSVTVLQDSHCGSVSTVALIEKCLRDTAIPHTFASGESSQLQDTLSACAQQANRGIILPSLEVAVELTTRHPAAFSKILERSRTLLIDGPIDMPGSYGVKSSIDIVEVDVQFVAKRIATDLVHSGRVRSTDLAIFQAKWIPGAINNGLVTQQLAQLRGSAQATRLRGSRIAAVK